MPPYMYMHIYIHTNAFVRASHRTCTLRLCVAEEGQGVAHLEQEGVTGTGDGGTVDQQLDQRTHSTTCAQERTNLMSTTHSTTIDSP
jgi:hypothetical protein